MYFFLGVHEPAWMSRTAVPLFVSARRLRRRKTLPKAQFAWSLDSGGFTELNLHGGWTVDAMTYSTEVRRWASGVGNLSWAAPQDWMCEPHILSKTGFSVAEHQRQTVENYLLLRQLAPDLPWVPVVQGWTVGDYLRCVGLYGERGVDLRTLPLVGLGSVCRRQGTEEIAEVVHALWSLGLKLHGFGVKAAGLRKCGRWLVSADSMAWSMEARRGDPLPGCTHATCANCLRYALRWRAELLESLPRHYQGRLSYEGWADEQDDDAQTPRPLRGVAAKAECRAGVPAVPGQERQPATRHVPGLLLHAARRGADARLAARPPG